MNALSRGVADIFFIFHLQKKIFLFRQAYDSRFFFKFVAESHVILHCFLAVRPVSEWLDPQCFLFAKNLYR